MKISVGICTYNGEKYIAEQLQSILAQTVLPDEIILTDDVSKDNTVEIAREILQSSGIPHTIVAHKEHQGILMNFVGCLDRCTGDIIFSCDQDDVWMPDKIESFLPHFENGCSFVYSNAKVVDSNRNSLQEDFWKCYGIDFKAISRKEFCSILLKNSCIAGCNMAFTKELYDKIAPIPYHFLHDSWVAICAPWFGEIAFVDKPLIEYRRHGNNVSAFYAEKKASEEPPKKPQALDKYKQPLPDQWFGNQHYYITSGLFYDRMKEYISDEYAKEVLRCREFFGVLLTCLPKQRIRSIMRLFGQYVKGNYKRFRGNEKRLLKDCLYLLVNPHTQFEHDKDAW